MKRRMDQSDAQFILDNPSWSEYQLAAHLNVPAWKVSRVRRGRLWSKLIGRPGYNSPVPGTNPAPVPVSVPRSRVHRSSAVSLPDAGETSEPVIGFRMWYVRDDGQPRATAHSEIVWSGELTARCVQGGTHPAPYVGCECGIHANDTLANVEQRLVSYQGDAARGHVVVGAIMLTGRVIEATAGYRAEKARVIAVATPKVDALPNLLTDDLVTAAAGFNLNVPKVDYASLAVYAAEFGQVRDAGWQSTKAERLAAHLKLRDQQGTYRKEAN